MSPPDPAAPLRIFATVGSTSFPLLISHLLSSSFLSSLPAHTHLTIQYGRSDLAAILTDGNTGLAAHADTDAHSAKVVEPGLRVSKSQGVTWKGSHASQMDPGRTGRISGWEIVDPDADNDGSDHSTESDTNRGANFTAFPSSFTFCTAAPSRIRITLVSFLPDLKPHLAGADVVIAHAGSGTILETLRLPSSASEARPCLMIVPNETLMDNHQVELAQAIAAGRWAWAASLGEGVGTKSLTDALAEILALREAQRKLPDAATAAQEVRAAQRQPFPQAKPQRFRDLVDSEMGYL